MNEAVEQDKPTSPRFELGDKVKFTQDPPESVAENIFTVGLIERTSSDPQADYEIGLKEIPDQRFAASNLALVEPTSTPVSTDRQE